jgi:hypothetical protein
LIKQADMVLWKGAYVDRTWIGGFGGGFDVFVHDFGTAASPGII